MMKCVYLLRSVRNPKRTCVGITDDLDSRLHCHNAGKSPHTAEHRPWRVVTATYFADDQRARDFERYLKSGSGRAFVGRHFL